MVMAVMPLGLGRRLKLGEPTHSIAGLGGALVVGVGAGATGAGTVVEGAEGVELGVVTGKVGELIVGEGAGIDTVGEDGVVTGGVGAAVEVVGVVPAMGGMTRV